MSTTIPAPSLRVAYCLSMAAGTAANMVARTKASMPVGISARQPALRLTRRGRIVFFGIPVVLLAALLVSLAGFVNAPAKAADTQADLRPASAVKVTVQPGESLWSIAANAVPGRDTRDVIAEIAQLNSLDAGRVMPGEQLFVPSR